MSGNAFVRRGSRASSMMRFGINLMQVRNRRTLAYPQYKTKAFGRKDPKSHTTTLRLQMAEFLGPKNFKGEYHLNKYFYLPQDHVTNYIKPDIERGQALKIQLDKDDTANNNRAPNRAEIKDRALKPFPLNPFCRTNLQISHELKAKIVEDIVEKQLPTQEVAIKYGLKIPRIEAIIKLNDIENKWRQQGLVTPEMQKMSQVMYKLFPLFNPQRNAENLTEIPIPQKTQNSRFLTIAESEPFGPVDAARVLDIEPAKVTLEKLSETGAHSSHHDSQNHKKNNQNSFVAPILEGEKSIFKFTDAKVGKVGYRYGTCLRDTKKDRKIGYDASGRMIYLL